MKWSWKLGRIAGIDIYVHAVMIESALRSISA
jgi:hypothetical protein